MYRMFMIHPSAEGHSMLYLSTISSRPAISLGEQALCDEVERSLGACSGDTLLDHVVDLFLSFLISGFHTGFLSLRIINSD